MVWSRWTRPVVGLSPPAIVTLYHTRTMLTFICLWCHGNFDMSLIRYHKIVVINHDRELFCGNFQSYFSPIQTDGVFKIKPANALFISSWNRIEQKKQSFSGLLEHTAAFQMLFRNEVKRLGTCVKDIQDRIKTNCLSLTRLAKCRSTRKS